MDRSLLRIGLNEIDWDDQSFAIRSFTAGTSLEASLGRIGVLSPPWVLKGNSEGMYAVVDGFKRLLWLKENGGADHVECLVYPAETDRSELMLHRITAKLFGAPLNVAEKARIVSLVSMLPTSEHAIAGVLAAAGVPARPGAVAKWRRLALESEPLLGAVATEEISERAALELTGWEDEAKGEALFALRELRCSSSIQMEILERITEVAYAVNTDRLDILRDPESRSILNHPDWNRRRKTQAFRDLLYRRRYPRLQAREERFRQDIASAGLPGGVRIVPPPAFEGEQWQLQLSFSSPENLQSLLKKAQTLASSPLLPVLIHPESRS